MAVTVKLIDDLGAAAAPSGADTYETQQGAAPSKKQTHTALAAWLLASSSLTGNPTAPTQAAGNNSTRLANTAFVATALANLVASSPATLDTLNELAAALANDPNFATTMTTALAGKLATANNLSDVPNPKTARANIVVDGRTGQGDADHTFVAADGPVYALTAALTAPRTWTLPAASALNAGGRIWVVDEAGGVSVTNTLTIARAGSDTIEGGTSVKLATPYGAVCLVSNGVSKWIKIAVVSLDQASHRVGDETPITSAATTDIGASPTMHVVVNGATGPITSLGTVANKLRIVRFASNPTLTHNATSLKLPAGGSNIIAQADDRAVFKSDSSGNWTCLFYQRASGTVGGREKLAAARTYYVRTDGSDSNTGLVNSAGGAFLTVQKAIDTVAELDLGIFDATIQCGNGTYTGANTLKTLVGAGKCIILGDTATPSNVVISTTSASCFSGNFRAVYSLRGIKMQTTTSGNGIFVSGFGALVLLDLVEFGACVGFHITAQRGASVELGGNYIISGGATRHAHAAAMGLIATKVATSPTVTLTGTPAFATAFAQAEELSEIRMDSITFSGAATGKRFDAILNAIVSSNGGGANYFPGSVAGTTATGGQYV